LRAGKLFIGNQILFSGSSISEGAPWSQSLAASVKGRARFCSHCGTVNEFFATKKPGVYRCRSKERRKDFSVTTKSVIESSHIKLNVWFQAFFLMASSKKGMGSHQLHRALGITYKSAWFLTHRIRKAMRAGGLMPPMGSNGAVVEADETYTGCLQRQSKKRTYPIRTPSLPLSSAAVWPAASISTRPQSLRSRPSFAPTWPAKPA
jgi:transposase-like protein